MRSRFAVRLVLAFVALSLAGAGRLQAAVPNRIAGAVSDDASVALAGHIHPQVKMAVDKGRLDGATQLPGLSLNFAPSATQQAALAALLAAQQDPSSASYHQWLTPAQFGAQFGMSADDLGKVTAWLQGHGLTVESVAPSNNSIHFSGTADQVERAFHTELHALSVNGEAHFANTTEPSLPAAFAGTVTSIRGLNNFRPKARARASAKQTPYAIDSRKVSASVGTSLKPFAVDPSTGDEYVAPEDFANIYDVKALYNAGFNGSASYPIGIIGQTAVKTSDLSAFTSAFGLSTSLPTMVLTPNTGTSAVIDTDDLSESELDLEWSGAVAPNAPVYFIYTGNTGCSSNAGCTYGVFDALKYAIQTYTVSGKPIPIISISYGECETQGDTLATLNTYEAWFQQANAQGQTILSASGDEGAAGCDYDTTASNQYAATQGLSVDYPASSAYVTGIGGTSFSGDLTSNSTYWSSSNDTDYGNELGLYIPSSTWNDTPTTATATNQGGLSASGGGVSTYWAKPSWQTGPSGIPADGKRDVPDLALSADPNHDGFLVCINGSCAQGYFNVYGGTSVAAPSFAGILALTEQKLAASQGNLNPALYRVAGNASAYASAFHDITVGTNIVPCIVSSTDTGCSGGFMGYSATTGFDLVTGLGAPDANNLATALTGISNLLATTETLAFTPAAPVTGQTVAFTATVAHATGTTAPTGSVVFTIDGAATGTSVPLSTTGTAAFSTVFTTGGSHTVAAVYSGDSIYYGSSATSPVTVTVPAGAATTTTLTVSPTTVRVGSSLTLTANVYSAVAGTLNGSVLFTTASGTLGTVNLALGSSGNTATAALTIPVAVATLPVGADTITATFQGGGTPSSSAYLNYGTSSGTASVTVTNPQITLSASPATITIASGGTVTSTITVTSVNGYAGTVAFSTPSITGYTFTPATVTVAAGGTATTVFSVSGVTAASKSGGTVTFGRAGGVSSLMMGGGATLAGLFLFGLTGRRRRRWSTLLSLVVFTGLTAAMGCGSSSSSGGTGSTPVTGTITIVGTDTSSSTITNSVALTVTLN